MFVPYHFLNYWQSTFIALSKHTFGKILQPFFTDQSCKSVHPVFHSYGNKQIRHTGRQLICHFDSRFFYIKILLAHPVVLLSHTIVPPTRGHCQAISRPFCIANGPLQIDECCSVAACVLFLSCMCAHPFCEYIFMAIISPSGCSQKALQIDTI